MKKIEMMLWNQEEKIYDIDSRIRHLLLCLKCQNQLRKDDNYCSHCGQRVKK